MTSYQEAISVIYRALKKLNEADANVFFDTNVHEASQLLEKYLEGGENNE